MWPAAGGPILRGPLPALSLLLLGVAISESGVSSQQAPQFRTTVDLTRLEATVLDKRTRQPVRGLTRDDFTVRVSGRAVPVTAMTEVAAPVTIPSDGPPAVRDVASNTSIVDRVFVIVMDDAYAGLRVDPFYNAEARKIAHTIVDSLGPSDKAAIVFSQDNRHAVDFTSDRAALRQAIDTYALRSLHPRLAVAMSLGTLQRARDSLLTLSGYRRSVAWITAGPQTNVTGKTEIADWNYLSNSIGADDAPQVAFRHFQRIVRDGALSGVPIYAFRTTGLQAPSVADVVRGRMESSDTNLFLDSVAARSGGDAYIETNTPSRDVARMFSELSSYYVLGVEGVTAAAGSIQRVEVAVRDPNHLVLPASMLFEVPRAGPDSRGAVGGMLHAFATPLAAGSIPLQMNVVPMAVPKSRDQALILTLGLPTSAQDDATDKFTVRTFVFDGEGRREVFQQTQSVTVRGGADRLAEITSRLALRPGRYNVRTYVERVGSQAVGSVFAQAVIPDFAGSPLSTSGIVLGRIGGRPVAGRESLADLLPFGPTVTRTFAPVTIVGALWRVYAVGDTAGDVTQTVEILNGEGVRVSAQTSTIPAEAFKSPAPSGVEQRFDLPLRSLADGFYVLRISAVRGTHRVEREVGFRVDADDAPASHGHDSR